MRPVERGNIPNAPATGSPLVFTQYDQALSHLVIRLGTYCSYCERCINNCLAVEHMLPKAFHPQLERDWENFLLACTNCNSIKGDTQLVLNDYYWPDRDNTALAFEYLEDGIVSVNNSLNNQQKSQAQRTLELTGLNRVRGHPRLSRKDTRWQKRQEIWGIAKKSLENLKRNDTSDIRELIVDLAKAQGCWSVWISVFHQDTDMLKRFINAFPGTCQDCFDAQYNKVFRPGGAL